MIGKLLNLAWPAFVYFCVATVLAEMIGVGMVFATGKFSKDKSVQMLAIAYDIDVGGMEVQKRKKARLDDRENPAFEKIIETRAIKNLDLDLRQQAFEKGLDELRILQATYMQDRERYDLLRTSFNEMLTQLKKDTKDSSILEVQRTLEAVNPKQAKDQLLRILLEQPTETGERPMSAVVTIVKSMAIDKRKKIFAEFKTEEEAKQLANILREIRLGVPEVPLIGKTQAQLQQFDTQQP